MKELSTWFVARLGIMTPAQREILFGSKGILARDELSAAQNELVQKIKQEVLDRERAILSSPVVSSRGGISLRMRPHEQYIMGALTMRDTALYETVIARADETKRIAAGMERMHALAQAMLEAIKLAAAPQPETKKEDDLPF